MTEERRSTFRCRTQLDDVAILRTDKQDIIVNLLEESSGGFGVLLPTSEITLQLDQQVDMITRRGSYRVCVRHITPRADGFRLGLKLMREVAGKAEANATSSGGKRQLAGNRFGGGRVSAGMFLLVIFAAGAAAPFLLGWSGGAGVKPELRIAQELPMATGFQHLLDSREFSQALNLSQAQETKIDIIVDEQFARLAKLYAEDKSSGARKAGGIQLIRAAWEQVIDVLSDEQKGLWDALLRQSINKSRQRGAGPRLIRVTPG